MHDLASSTNPFTLLAIAVVALLYSSVGHGGASGYLAILTLLSVPKAEAASTALLLNVMVASTSAYSYYRAKFLNLKTTSMYLAASVPAAFLGGLAKIPTSVYETVLFISLAAAACRLAIPLKEENVELRPPKFWMAAMAGGIIGLLSGLVGIGGGIFLSPLIVLSRWDTPKQASGTAALFIVVNSIAGIVGRLLSHTFIVNNDWTFVLVAFIGGVIGSHLGANIFSQITLKRVLAGVLGIACAKLVLP
ncbi:MAG TPA: sulfite exporter TauE/SafE family protein [Drouetiella sp.]